MAEQKADSQNFMRALFWALLAFFAWTTFIAPRFLPKAPPPQETPPTTTAPADVSDAGTQPTTRPGAQPATAEGPAQSLLSVMGSDEAETITLGSTAQRKKSPWRMEVTIANQGASIDSIRLSDHKKSVDSQERYLLIAPLPPHEGVTARSFSLDQISVDGAPLQLDDVYWKAVPGKSDDEQSVDLSVTITQAGSPVLELVRNYTLPAQNFDRGRHDLRSSLQIRNLTDEAHEIIISQDGAVGLAREGRFRAVRKVYAAERAEGIIKLEAKNFAEVAKKQSIKMFTADPHDRQRLAWTGAGNLYFTCTYCPVQDDGTDAFDDIAEVQAVDLDENSESDADATVRMVMRPITLAAGQTHTLHAQIYAGPKDRYTFESPKNPDYVRRDYMQQIKQNYGSCTFNFLADIMIRLLNWLEGIVHNFGVAIILMVIVVRAILHPITKRTQVNMVKMQKNTGQMKPRLDEIKKKYAGDNSRMQQEIMKVYREEGINPFTQVFGCLPMLLQMPIWIALYTSLNNNVAMRCRGFVWWIKDLTAPDCLHKFSSPVHVPLLPDLDCFNLLPLLVGIMMFAQQKLMPKPQSPVADTGQSQQAEQMQKMMPYMSLIMIFFFYGFPSGLNLYIMTSSLFGAVEQLYIRKHISKQDLEPHNAAAKRKPRKPLPGQGFLARLAKKAEEAQQLRSSRDKQSKKR